MKIPVKELAESLLFREVFSGLFILYSNKFLCNSCRISYVINDWFVLMLKTSLKRFGSVIALFPKLTHEFGDQILSLSKIIFIKDDDHVKLNI